MKKSIFSRFITMFVAMFSVMILGAMCFVSASAAEVESTADTSAIVMETEDAETISVRQPVIKHFGAGGTGTTGGTTTSADSTFQNVVNFFVTWLRRIGALVAFIGGIMFALAIKNNDADQKQSGLLTMVAGFVAAALCTAVDMFDIFS
ncbi:MAG: hypothetical protein PUC41_05335 [Oscillospiraceae bacterium]|nr:hypothetical protein [Oscillospiraceae bacterium]